MMGDGLIGCYLKPELSGFHCCLSISLMNGDAISHLNNGYIAGFTGLLQVLIQGKLKLTADKSNISYQQLIEYFFRKSPLGRLFVALYAAI